MKYQTILQAAVLLSLQVNALNVEEYEDDHTALFVEGLRKEQDLSQFHGVRMLNETITIVDPSLDFLNANETETSTLKPTASTATPPTALPTSKPSATIIDNEVEVEEEEFSNSGNTDSGNGSGGIVESIGDIKDAIDTISDIGGNTGTGTGTGSGSGSGIGSGAGTGTGSEIDSGTENINVGDGVYQTSPDNNGVSLEDAFNQIQDLPQNQLPTPDDIINEVKSEIYVPTEEELKEGLNKHVKVPTTTSPAERNTAFTFATFALIFLTSTVIAALNM